MRFICRYALAGLLALIVSSPAIFAAQPIETGTQGKVRQSLNSVPLAFEPNVGQSVPDTRFIIHRPDLNARFASDSVTLLLPQNGRASARLGMDFSRSAPIVAERELPGKTNYFRGNNPAQWHTGIANFGRIRYNQLWPGTDLVFYGNGERLEHDFILAPGADPRKISFELKGAQSLETTQAGDLLVHLEDTIVTFKKPIAYQETTTGRSQVAATFKVNGSRISFSLGRYDHRRTLTIDPVLVFSTLLVGSVFDEITGMALDSSGNIYVTGETGSSDFPTTASSVQPACDACNGLALDAFVTKLNPTGTALVYSTFIGGSDFDTPHSIVVDSSGNATIAGNTFSSDFPAVNPIGTFTTSANWHMFVTSLSATGSSLNYSGIVGPLNVFQFGSSAIPSSIRALLAVDSSGNVYATTQTIFSTFPTTPSALAPVPPNPQAALLMAMKISPTGSLVYSTAIPGRAAPGPPGNFGAPGPNTFFQDAIAVDSGGNAYIAGQADDGLPTTLGVIGPAFASTTSGFASIPQEGFLLKVNPAGSALVYATYIPGASRVLATRLDSSGNIFLGGDTFSGSLPVSATGFQKDPGCTGCQADFVLKVNNLATSVLAGTYLRGAPRNLTDQSTFAGMGLDPNGNVFVTGIDTEALNFPMKNPLEQLRGGFIVELSSDLSTLLFSSGGPGDAYIEAPSASKLILASNAGFPPTAGAFQTTVPAARGDLFSVPNVSAIDLTVAAPTVCLGPFFLDFGSGVTAPGTTSAPQSATVTNCGNADLHISSVASDSPDFNVTTTCALAPAGIAAGSSCKVTATYSPVDYKSGNAVIQDDAVASPHKVGLSGFPKAPVVGFFPGLSLTFPETPVTSSDSIDMEIFGSAILATVTSMTTTGDFTVSQNCLGVLPPPAPIPFPPGFIPQPCHFTVSFVPTNTGTRLGTVIVKDTALDSPQVIQLTGLGIAAWPTPTITNGVSVNVAGVAGNVASSTGNPQTLVLTGGGFSRLTTTNLDGIPFDGNNRLMKIVGPQEIDLSLTDNDFADVGEVQVRAVTPTPGGGTSNNVVTITSPIKFYETILRDIELVPAGSMVVGPKSGLIYDAFGSVIPPVTAPNITVPSVAVIDPAQERLVSGLVGFPNIATLLAISDDEQFLYAELPASNSVAQISLPGGAVNFIASLGKDAALGNYNATAIRVMPGHPHTWVAALQPLGDPKPIALKVFDDGVPRANAVEHGNATLTFPGKLLFVGNDTTTLYSIDSTSLYRFNIDANGITIKDKTDGLGAEDFATDGTFIYLSTGAIIDPGTLANKGNFALAPGLPVHAVTVDSTTSRAIFAGDATTTPGQGSLVQAFDTSTLAAKGTFTMSNLSGVTSMSRWGASGLAFTIFSGPVIVTRSSLTGNSALLAPFHIGANGGAAALGTAQVQAGSPATYNIGVLGVNGFTGPITLSCSNLPQFASCSFAQNPVIIGGGNITCACTTVTVSTHQAATASAAPAHLYMRSGTGFVLLTAVLSIPFALAFAGRRYRGKLLTLCLIIAIIGCGGGGGSGGGGGGGPSPTPLITPTPTPSGQNTPIGIYTITLTGTSASGATRHATLQLIVL